MLTVAEAVGRRWHSNWIASFFSNIKDHFSGVQETSSFHFWGLWIRTDKICTTVSHLQISWPRNEGSVTTTQRALRTSSEPCISPHRWWLAGQQHIGSSNLGFCTHPQPQALGGWCQPEVESQKIEKQSLPNNLSYSLFLIVFPKI